MQSRNLTLNLIILVVGALLFISGPSSSVHLFDWDEINFAECAREMIVTGDYSRVLINFEPFWEKPPLFFWLQVISMKIFGINEFAARLPNALCGVITLLVLFNLGSKHFGERFGIVWVLVYAGSFLPHFYFKSGIIDPWFNLFIFLGIYYFVLYVFHRKLDRRNISTKPIILSAIFIGLAVLTKGPVAALIFGLCVMVFWAWERFKFFFAFRHLFLWIGVLALTGGSWFIVEIMRGRFDVIVEFFDYQVRLFQTKDAGHGGPFFYHFLVLLLGCFPASVLAIKAHKASLGSKPFEKLFKIWMLILLWVVLILFSIVKTKIVHYSSAAYFPITFLAAWFLMRLENVKVKQGTWPVVLTSIVGLVLGIAIILIPFLDKYKSKIVASGIIKDDFATANLMANVRWSGYESLVGLILVIGIFIYWYLIRIKEVNRAYRFLFFASMITVNLTIVIFVPKIERYSQGAAIDFFKSIRKRDVYAETLYFKSYAHLYYSDKRNPVDLRAKESNWVLTAPDVDKPVFAVAKITREKDVAENYPQLREIYRKNGFIFYRRTDLKFNALMQDQPAQEPSE
jgi:4-amino-4-deoxy-L-arabinose transferase-like glycosyltransferase